MPPVDDSLLLVHASDLHLHLPLVESGRRLRGWRAGIRTHRYFYLQAATEAVERAALGAAEGSAVALAVTGDLTTAGAPAAFALARQIVQGADVQEGERSYPVGLNGGEWPYLTVPGNHDRFSGSWIALQESAFEDEFVDQLPIGNWSTYGLPTPTSQVGTYPRLPYVQVLYGAGASDDYQGAGARLAVVCVGLDSTALGTKDRLDLAGRIAQGRVAATSLNYLAQVSEDVRRNRRVVDSSGRVHALDGYVTRVFVLLHHHPHLPPDQVRNRMTRLLNARAVLDQCAAAGVDALLFGHQHISFVDTVTLGSHLPRPTSLVCAAAGSLSVFDESAGNSFNIYRVGPHRLEYETWRFDRGRFRPGQYRGELSFADRDGS